ncbi:uncharacterized protein LOC132723078 [Ruditapes philippinarum]|uniref:uncharacterized protein LOC132723078 n=1 Tax=Ruditapes philippinarum TaxID=129788 RepID=UPI00295A7E73|nr:uncharacterized protein LOC132723078 [Ruditapes philippinarum]
MSDDILRQAELRQQRRPKSRQNEEILPLDVSKHKNPNLLIGDKLHVDGSCLPPIRHSGNYDKSAGGNIASLHNGSETHDALSSSKQIGQFGRPRTPRRRIASHSDRLDVTNDAPVVEKDKRCIILPFIKCKIQDKIVKALISTTTQRSTISHRLLDGVRCKNDSVAKSVEICGQEVQVNLFINDSALHDLVFGMDFIYDNNCILDFAAYELKMKENMRTPFLSESDIPLKFRNRPGLASSI